MEPSLSRRWLTSQLDLENQAALLGHRAVKTAFIALGIVLIVAQQGSLLLLTDSPDPFYRNVLNLGASYQRYFSFFYYFGGFPVNLDGLKTRTLEEASVTLAETGSKLRTDLNVYNRASIFLLYPDAWWKGRPVTAEMRTGHAIWFTIGLLSVFGALSYSGTPLLGLLVALLCGSNPFQVYETYHQGSATIFPTVISTGLVITGLCLLLSSRRFERHSVMTPLLVCVMAIVCALQYEIRLEGVGVFAGAVFAVLFLFPHSARRRVAFLVLFVLVVVTSSRALNGYFNAAMAKADSIVARHGGSPAGATNAYYSTQWWALWSGLGDFDEKYGFLADDRAGISYYYGHDTSVGSEVSLRRNYLRIVAQDPAWWLGVVGRRLKRVLVENTPYRIGYGTWHRDVPVPPLIVTLIGTGLLLASVLIQGKAKVAFFVLPFSIGLVSVGQLADYGLQFYCIVHLFVAAYVVCFLFDCALALMRPMTGTAPPA